MFYVRHDGAAAVFSLIAILALGVLLVLWEAPLEYLKSFIGENQVVSALVFIFLMFIATVVAPLLILPFVPAVAIYLGPFPTALYSIVGWTLGAVAAFLIARYLGRPIVGRLVSLERIARYEQYIQQTAQFWWLVALRMALPVDILSYAVGLLSSMPLWQYTLATAIGVAPFSFIFSYLGVAFLSGRYEFLVGLVVLGIFLFSFAYYFTTRSSNRR